MGLATILRSGCTWLPAQRRLPCNAGSLVACLIDPNAYLSSRTRVHIDARTSYLVASSGGKHKVQVKIVRLRLEVISL